MYQIIFASGNAGKMKEIKEILVDLPAQILSMKEAGINVNIVENATSFEANALIKARAVASVLGQREKVIVLADDSGLEIDWLNGEPGIYSARYMNEKTSYMVKNANLLARLNGVPLEKRTARFVCAIVAVFLNGEILTTRGVIEGKIGYEERGDNGFGYDPIFYLPDMSKTTAELTSDEKNVISHRGNALKEMKKVLLEKMQRMG
ncbi:MAG: RdgB/HAM1 family non-canonical purine NTP pyrophosphatase [Lachnospiraceae bacterium]|nr:RdgB/HAM1 family non-canonical purine NTP pyrophosphatase [Lachnospiraceae bacterium]